MTRLRRSCMWSHWKQNMMFALFVTRENQLITWPLAPYLTHSHLTYQTLLRKRLQSKTLAAGPGGQFGSHNVMIICHDVASFGIRQTRAHKYQYLIPLRSSHIIFMSCVCVNTASPDLRGLFVRQMDQQRSILSLYDLNAYIHWRSFILLWALS